MNTYHDQLDAFEARVRAEQAETDYEESRRHFTVDDYPEGVLPEICICLEYIGDNGTCPIHGEREGSDTSMAAQLNDAGFGTQGVF